MLKYSAVIRRLFMRIRSMLTLILLFTCIPGFSQTESPYPIQPIEHDDLRFSEGFWLEQMETIHRETIPHALQMCRETGRIRNFEIAAGLTTGTLTAFPFDDTDLYKIIEGASYLLAMKDDPHLRARIDTLIGLIGHAQEDDGYLYTWRTAGIDPDHHNYGIIDTLARWHSLDGSHELYNAGHLYEAAVAHYTATGDSSLLRIALKNADLIVRTFGPDGIHAKPGHQEIEIGLVKLYRLTGDKRYLDQARYFLEERGKERSAFRDYNPESKDLWKSGKYWQDHLPVTRQKEPVGHVVRALYMYSGMADVAAHTSDSRYFATLDTLWKSVVNSRLYLTGGMGLHSGGGEAFGAPYNLPNAEAYSETCGAVANIFWNHRMFLHHGHAKYIDVLERSLYNNVLSGFARHGRCFFYTNPLEAGNEHRVKARKKWFRVACCPGNISRLIPSVGQYAYASRDDSIYVNLYMNGSAQISMERGIVSIDQSSNYPWDGEIGLTVKPEQAEMEFTLLLRIPGWARNGPVPGDLYRYADRKSGNTTIKINGRETEYSLEDGFAVFRRSWQAGDTIHLSIPVPVRKVRAHPNVEADRGKIALERGPIVYCAEEIDNPEGVFNRILPEGTNLAAKHQTGSWETIPAITGDLPAVIIEQDSLGVATKAAPFRAIPYYLWANREQSPMRIWFPAKVTGVNLVPAN